METAAHEYCAFISYSHTDSSAAQWLQRALESYRIPKRLVVSHARSSNRLGKIFRDREDLASSGDLASSIQAALEKSEFLIVLCSPAAVDSPYVKHEIDYFLTQRDRSRVLCLIVAGEPSKVIPKRLLENGHEPLAADLRNEADGRANARLKLIAGLLEVGFDDLKVREVLRQRRRWIVAGSASFALTAAMTLLAVVTMIARQETERSRNQAEDLIGYMLTDLRAQLEPIGRLDVLDSVGNRAMRYFAEVRDGAGSATVLAKRSIALRQIGEVRVEQGHFDGAYEALVESRRIARSRVEQFPDQFDAHYELGQTEFWLAVTRSMLGDPDDAERGHLAYLEAAKRMIELRPDSEVAQLELTMATANMGALHAEAMRPGQALPYFLESLSIQERLPASTAQLEELANLNSWIGDTYIQLGNLTEARRYHDAHIEILHKLEAGSGTDRTIDVLLGDGLLVNVELLIRQQNLAAALINAREAERLFHELANHDPTNAYWLRGLFVSHLLVSEICIRQLEMACATRSLHEAEALIGNQTLANVIRFERVYLDVLKTELLLENSHESPEALRAMLDRLSADIADDSLRARQISIRAALLRARIRLTDDPSKATAEISKVLQQIDEAMAITNDPAFNALQDEAALLTAELATHDSSSTRIQ